MEMSMHAIIFLGRMCLSTIFILSAINKIFHWHEVEQSVMVAMGTLAGHLSNIEILKEVFAVLQQHGTALVNAAIGIELIGGLLIFLGIKARLGAFILIVFMVPTTLLFHTFWYMQGPERELQQVMFLKNLSIFGGLLLLLGCGCKTAKAYVPAAAEE